MAERKRTTGLGRGLSALLDEAAAGTAAAPTLTLLPLAAIVANADQPRRRFDVQAMDDLIASVRARGVLQPILVRPILAGGYEIVAGERRWRAAAAAQLHEIPVIVRELDDAAAFEIALVENIQRSDLNPIEEAEGFQRLVTDYGHTQETLAKIVGKARSHVANLLRLLDLPPEVRELVAVGALGMGHARALVASDDAVELAHRAVAERLSVRQVEALTRRPRGRPTARAQPAEPDANVAELENRLGEALGMSVVIDMTEPSQGMVAVRFSTLDQLDLLCRLLESPSGLGVR